MTKCDRRHVYPFSVEAIYACRRSSFLASNGYAGGLLGDAVNSPPTLEGVALKLIRAGNHFDALRDVCEKAIKESAGKPVVKREGEWEVVRVPIREFPSWPSIVSGDYVHNLRSALDHLVWQLVKVSEAKPGPWNSFPGYGDKDDFIRDVKQRAKKRGPGPLKGIDPGGPIWALIESYQPYNSTKLPPWLPTDMPDRDSWKPRLTHLGILNALNNIDKHRTIHGFSVFPGKEQPINKCLSWNSEAVLVQQIDRETWEPLEDNAELARFRFRPGIEPNVRVTGPIIFQAGFEVEFAKGKAFTILMPSMNELQVGIKSMVDSFIEFFLPSESLGRSERSPTACPISFEAPSFSIEGIYVSTLHIQVCTRRHKTGGPVPRTRERQLGESYSLAHDHRAPVNCPRLLGHQC